jgi:glycogen operon protein
VGNFPPLWHEWNGKYRDEVRDFWRSAEGALNELAFRFTGSSDLYESNGRRPAASINFITAHDGFPLEDLVSYNEKHNEANGENNNDGESHNRSWNHGAEGPTDDPEIRALRDRQKRNLLTTWFDWAHADRELFRFVAELIQFRHSHPVFKRRRWFQGVPVHGNEGRDIAWLRQDGQLMSDEDWQRGDTRHLAVFLNGQAIPSLDERGERIVDDSFYVLFNAHWEPLTFRLVPDRPHWGERWARIIDTTSPHVRDNGGEEGPEEREVYSLGGEVRVEGRSVVVLKRVET